MSSIMKKFLIAASTAVGMSAIATTPSFAYSITGKNDILLYDNDTTTCPANSTCVTTDMSRLDAILGGNSSAPGGNVELFATSEKVSLEDFKKSNDRTNIEGTVAGKSLTLSSLTATDWFGSSLDVSYGVNNFANQWFNEFYVQAGLNTQETELRMAIAESIIAKTSITDSFTQSVVKNLWKGATSDQVRGFVYNAYLSDDVKGFQRTSDPNISYVTTSGSDLLIGLAGHYDTKAYYKEVLGSFANFIKDGFQVSEVVKVNYGGVEDFLYNFSATESGLLNNGGPGADYKSHSGNYEVKLAGVVTPPESVPEPSVVFGLIGLGGLLAAKRKQQQAE